MQKDEYFTNGYFNEILTLAVVKCGGRQYHRGLPYYANVMQAYKSKI